MLEFQRRHFIFTIKEVWFAEYPYEVSNCDSVLFCSCPSNVQMKDFDSQEQATLVIDLAQDLTAIWKNMKRTTRRDINHAKERGVKITINQKYDEFYDLLRAFREKKQLRGIVSAGFMKKYGTLILAELDGQILGGIFSLEDKNHVRLLMGGSNRFGATKEIFGISGDANRLIIWEAITHAKNKGAKEFDFGGYYTGNEDPEKQRINFFKTGFGGKLTTRYTYRKDYSRLYTLGKRLYDMT